jgi:hypothetical protein
MGKRFLVTAYALIVIVIETFTGWVIDALRLAFPHRPRVKGFVPSFVIHLFSNAE